MTSRCPRAPLARGSPWGNSQLDYGVDLQALERSLGDHHGVKTDIIRNVGQPMIRPRSQILSLATGWASYGLLEGPALRSASDERSSLVKV